MKHEASFRYLVTDAQQGCRHIRDLELRALAVAALAEMSRRDGVVETATWAADQVTRLRSLDAVTS